MNSLVIPEVTSIRDTAPLVENEQVQAHETLRPLYDDLISESESADGVVFFVTDRQHGNRFSGIKDACAFVTLQRSDEPHRYDFFEKNIRNHRVTLGGTALGTALSERYPRFIRSRMNPSHHMTWGAPSFIDTGDVVGATQAAFTIDRGPLPDQKVMDKLWLKHSKAIIEAARAAFLLSERVPSLSDVLKLYPPVTPNAFVINWDQVNSTDSPYPAERTYLTDMKKNIETLLAANGYNFTFHDRGDGQDIIIWLPDSVDSVTPASVTEFGKQNILPVIHRLLDINQTLATERYADITPEVRIALTVCNIEYDPPTKWLTSPEFWTLTKLKEPLALTEQAVQYLGEDFLEFSR